MKNKIKEIREARGISQAQLSDKTGISQQMISKIENQGSRITVEDAIAFAIALNVPFAELYEGGKDTPLKDVKAQENLTIPEKLIKDIRIISGVSVQKIAAVLDIAAKEYTELENTLSGSKLGNDQALKIAAVILSIYLAENMRKTILGAEPDLTLDEKEKELLNAYRQLASFNKDKATAVLSTLL